MANIYRFNIDPASLIRRFEGNDIPVHCILLHNTTEGRAPGRQG